MLKYVVSVVRSGIPGLATLVGLSLGAGLAAPISAQAGDQAQAGDEAPAKIAVINLDFVALGSPAGQALQQQVLTFQQDLAAELQVRQDAARGIEQRVAEADSLSEEERRVLEREYQDALTGLQRFQQDKQEEATLLRADGLARIQSEIAPVIERIQVELGYDIVLNSQNGLIVIYSERVDITQLVVDRLQAASPDGS